MRKISGLIERDAHPFAQKRIVFFRNRQISEWFVTADVERANDERMLFANGLRDCLSASELFVFARRCAPLHEKKSERSRPTPSPRELQPVSLPLALRCSRRFNAFAVRAPPARACARSSLCRFSARSCTLRMRVISSGGGFNRSVPLLPSSTTLVSFGTSSAAGSTPASAGMPNERARIAPCEVAPPRVVANPITRVRSSAAVSEGVRSSAMRIVFGG